MIEEIMARLEELDRMESQILFSASFLSKDDYEQLDKIKAEKRTLEEKLNDIKEIK